MNNFVLLAGAGDFFHTTPIFAKYQFISKCFHLRAGARHHLSSWGAGAKGLSDSLPPRGWNVAWEMVEGERGGIICRHARSVKREFLGATLQGIWACPLVVCPQGNKGWYLVFMLCVSPIPPGSCFLITVKWGSFGVVSKWASYFHGGYVLPYEARSRVLFLVYLALFSSLSLSHKSTLTPVQGALAWKLSPCTMSM